MGVTRKNLQCGRRVIDGSVPPICHVHKAAAAGVPLSPNVKRYVSANRSPEELLTRLLQSKDERIILSALELLRRREERGTCIQCDLARERQSATAELLTVLDAAQRLRLLDALAIIRDVKAEVNHGPERQHHQPPRTSADVPEPPAIESPAADIESAADAEDIAFVFDEEGLT